MTGELILDSRLHVICGLGLRRVLAKIRYNPGNNNGLQDHNKKM